MGHYGIAHNVQLSPWLFVPLNGRVTPLIILPYDGHAAR